MPMRNLLPAEFEAMAKFQADWPIKRVRKYYPNAQPRNWKGVLILAWLCDWSEQRGTLRSVRNDIGIQEAFVLFDKIVKERGISETPIVK